MNAGPHLADRDYIPAGPARPLLPAPSGAGGAAAARTCSGRLSPISRARRTNSRPAGDTPATHAGPIPRPSSLPTQAPSPAPPPSPRTPPPESLGPANGGPPSIHSKPSLCSLFLLLGVWASRGGFGQTKISKSVKREDGERGGGGLHGAGAGGVAPQARPRAPPTSGGGGQLGFNARAATTLSPARAAPRLPALPRLAPHRPSRPPAPPWRSWG